MRVSKGWKAFSFPDQLRQGDIMVAFQKGKGLANEILAEVYPSGTSLKTSCAPLGKPPGFWEFRFVYNREVGMYFNLEIPPEMTNAELRQRIKSQLEALLRDLRASCFR